MKKGMEMKINANPNPNPKANAWKLVVLAGVMLMFPMPASSQISDFAPHASPSSSQPPLVSSQVKPGVAINPAKNFSGKWQLIKNANQSRQRMSSIENAIAGFGRFKQGRAREMLTQKTAPPAKLTIIDSGAEIKIARNGQEFTVPTNGQAVSINSPEGRVTLRAGRRDRKLVVETKSANATNTTTFELSSDGKTMTQTVQLQASALSKTIQFTISFVR